VSLPFSSSATFFPPAKLTDKLI